MSRSKEEEQMIVENKFMTKNIKDFRRLDKTDLIAINEAPNWIMYAATKNKEILLSSGEYLCQECRGWGYFLVDYKTEKSDIIVYCSICKRAGKVDWITNILKGTKG